MYTNLYDDPLVLGATLASMIVWSFLYLPLAWYIERVLPGEYGTPLPFYFPLLPSYWLSSDKVHVKQTEHELNDVNKVGFENEPLNLVPTIRMNKISKSFRDGFKYKQVVNDLTVNFYDNQITGLLGHNGAGKTTTTFMLSGIYAPSSGSATILGYDIKTQMEKIRTSMGFCPQHDILYDLLTVRDHINLLAAVRFLQINILLNLIVTLVI